MALNTLVDSFLSQSEAFATERVMVDRVANETHFDAIFMTMTI